MNQFDEHPFLGVRQTGSSSNIKCLFEDTRQCFVAHITLFWANRLGNTFLLHSVLLKIFRFALVSGAGLALDVCIFLFLVHLGIVPLIANICSAAASTTFVYCVSISKIFTYQGKFALPLFAIYCLYQFIAIVTASYFVGLLATCLGQPLLAKMVVLPFTFSANFLFMTLLTRQRSNYLERT